MQTDTKTLKPLYFHLKSVPKCAFYEYDNLTTNYTLSEETIHKISIMFPKSLSVPAEEFGPNGYPIRTRGSPFITIVCTDQTASLELNDLKIHLGVGTFTFPTAVMCAMTLRLFHQGPARIEYRSLDYELIEDLRLVSFNVVCSNMKQKEMVAAVLCEAFLKADSLVAPDRMHENVVQKLEGAISRLKEAGLLHDDPV